MTRPSPRDPLPEVLAIQHTIAVACGVTVTDILSPRRGRALEARKLAMWLARRITRHSYPALGRAFNRDHTVVMRDVLAIERAIGGPPPGR